LRETTFRPPMHTTREAESSAYAMHPQTVDYDSAGKNLPDIPSRAGYVQRWVRNSDPTAGGGDTNFQQRWMAGWRPRPLETVPELFSIYWSHLKSAKAPDQLQVGQMTLMEMPEEVFQRRMARIHERNTRYRDIAAESLEKVNQLGGGIATTFSNSNSSVSVGRAPSTMAG
jgi:hypothetical protein